MEKQINKKGKISWRSPSNIALVKYWGKKPVQLPGNPSLSMTLSRAYTEMTLEYWPGTGKDNGPLLEFIFEGKTRVNFEERILTFLQSLFAAYPVLKNYKFKITSHNSFPHSAGIASSASSMSALGLCLAELIFSTDAGETAPDISFKRKASGISRLASGSACRSVFGGYVLWGYIPRIEGSSDEYSIPVPFEVDPAFRNMNDAILIVSSKEKRVSSSAGHSTMVQHPYAGPRYDMAMTNISELLDCLRSGDISKFIRITESEALNLHALMMSSHQSYMLFEPQTINIVNSILVYRKSTHIPVCFTLDAGPNVHLLYPASYETRVKDFINSELTRYCEDGKWIDDRIGEGPEQLTVQS